LWNYVCICFPTIERKGLIEIQRRSGVFIQFACAANKTVNNSLFGKHLLRKIARRNTDVSVVFEEISNEVYQESNFMQQPLSINGLQDVEQVYLNEVMSK
jgi:hypothetical protein